MTKDEIQITQMGNGYVVTFKGIGQRVFTSRNECARYIGSIMMSGITHGDAVQVDLEFTQNNRMPDEAEPVMPGPEEE